MGAVILGEPRAAAAAAARRLGLHYLQRYFFLIAFRRGGQGLERACTGGCMQGRWLHLRPVHSASPASHWTCFLRRPPAWVLLLLLQGVPGEQPAQRAGPLLWGVGAGAAGAQVPHVAAGAGLGICHSWQLPQLSRQTQLVLGLGSHLPAGSYQNYHSCRSYHSWTSQFYYPHAAGS